MNAKQTAALQDFLQSIDDPYRAIFAELAEFAAELGYMPVRNKTHDITIDFRNSRVKKTIMKMEQKEQKHDGLRYGESGVPGLRLRFFAADSYSEIFQSGIRRVIEEFDGKYTGCYGCGRCDGTQGYTNLYPDGRSVYRCGTELISVFHFGAQDIPEIKSLLKAQADFYAQRA